MNTNEVTLIDDLLSKEENLALINKLCYHQWYLTKCLDYGNLMPPLFAGRGGGFSVSSLEDGNPFDSPLNKEAYKITKKVCEQLDIKKYVNSSPMIFNETHKEVFQSFKKLYYDNVDKFVELQDRIVK